MLPISAAFDAGERVIFTLKLPIHKSLETQFKCFADFGQMLNGQRIGQVLAREVEHALNAI